MRWLSWTAETEADGTHDSEEVFMMKGYYTGFGYMGYVDGEYMLFDCESDYRAYLTEMA